ncbi:helix-turn-helix domain-containing protein [Microbacterium aurantiacum]|uniref:Helix-turn-helix domain-containing protein n=1 Tax=Microbacterium aurantiacum TaxID=162393 RepID=A0AAJ2HD26_9MICO|nr:helix-turn-helix domain-containing protein [Microbacterium aurantiacum]MBN9201266.1 helix-turn-helix domain-containing protein [Microbacterium chocolatum]MDS0245282.1 helix-turn-helix domain-containing protein [Microbacterium aurantiacum]
MSEAGAALSPAVTRAGDLLDVLALGERRTLAELVDHTGLAKSSVSDLCRALVEVGFAERASDGSFALGPRMGALIRRSVSSPRLVDAFAALTIGDSGIDDHTLSLGALEGGEVVTIDVRLGQQPLTVTPRPGHRDRVTECAAGIAIVSALDRDTLDAQLALHGPTLGLSADEGDAVRSLESSDHVAWWRSRTGLQQLACPIPGGDGLAAITLHVPQDPHSRLDLTALGRELDRIARALGSVATA